MSVREEIQNIALKAFAGDIESKAALRAIYELTQEPEDWEEDDSWDEDEEEDDEEDEADEGPGLFDTILNLLPDDDES